MTCGIGLIRTLASPDTKDGTLTNLFLLLLAEPVKVKVTGDNQSAASIVVKSVDLKFLAVTNFGAARPKFQFLLLPPQKVEQFPTVKDSATISAFQSQYSTISETFNRDSQLTPWFDEYRTKFFKSLGPSAFEQFEHPIAAIVATTSQDLNPVDSLQRLFDRRATNIQNGLPRYVDLSVVVYHYVLVHDANGPVPIADAMKRYALVEKTWPGQTTMVTLNSHKEAIENEDFQIWRSDSALKSTSSGLSSSQLPLPIPGSPSSSITGDLASSSVPNSPLGSAIKGSSLSLASDAPRKGFYSRKVFISTSDMDSCKRLVRTLVWSWIIPHLEKTVQTIYPEVTKERSGLMHKFNLMWGSKFSRKNDENDPDGVLFEAASLEFRERRLADWAFMLGDFTVAYRTYMSLAEIYKNEAPTAPVALVYRASALEMAANSLCLLASNNASLATPQQWAEIDRHFVEAWDLYQRGRRRTWARRSALSHAYWAQWRLQASGSSAWERLVNDSTDPLELALLHQQRAFSYLLRSPARIRNYAFDLVKAADAFTTGHQFLHAVTCYFAAHQVYSMQTWSAVSDYLHFRIARLANVVDRPDLAMQFITALLTENGQTAPIQNSSLREYLHIFRTYGSHLPFKLSAAHSINNQATIPALASLPIAPVPLLHRRVKLHVLDVPGGSSNATSEWSALESSIIEVMTPPDKRYLLTLKKPSTKVEHLGVVGEFIYVDVVLTNPLKVPLQFTDMRLACHLTPSYSAMASGLSRRGSLSKADRPLAPASSSDDPAPAIDQPDRWEAEKHDKLFGPGETRTVQFTVKPLIEGSLSIVGVIFKLCGVLEAFRPLAKPSVIKVSVPMPRVSLSLLGLPAASDSTRSALYVGQHHEVCLRIKNLGQKPLHNLAFTSSQPHLFLSDSLKEDLSLPHKWAARIPLTAPLQQDQTIDVPIVLRPTAEGTHTVQILVYYEPSHSVGPPSDIKHRLTRATFTLRVVKSIRCHTTIRPDPLQIDRYLLTLDVDNQTKLKTKSGVVIAIRDLRITSPNWRPVLLDAATGEPYVDVSKRIISQSPIASSSDDSPASRPLTPLSEDSSAAPSPARTPVPLSKMSLHATTGASSYDDSSCMRPEILETAFGGAHLLPTVLPPRHATTLLFRLERKLPGDEDYEVPNATMVLSPASAARAPDTLAARFLSQESIITRRNQAPKRSALFDNRTPEELAEAKRVHDTNVANEISLFVSWAVANDINSTSSASLSALTLTLPSNHPGSSPKSAPKSGHARPTTNFFASVNAFDIPFVPQSPWTGHVAQAAAPSTSSGASGAEPVQPDSTEAESRSLTAQVGLHYCAPVHISLEYPSVVRHAFARGPAFIPVILHIFNTSAFSPLQLTFEALKPSEYASIPRSGVSGAPPATHSTPWKTAQQSNAKRRPAIPAEEGRSHYLWMGRTTHSVAQLDVETPTSFALQACFPLPGAYNLNRWRIWVAPVAFPSRKVAVYASHQHFTTIVDDPSAPTTSVEWGASSRLGNSSLHQSLFHSKFARFSGSLLDESTADALNSSYALTESHNAFLTQAPLEASTAPISATTISESPPFESDITAHIAARASLDEAHEADVSTEQTEESFGPTEVALADSTPTDLSAAVFHIDENYNDLGASYAAPLPTNSELDETFPETVASDSPSTLNDSPTLNNSEGNEEAPLPSETS